MKFGAKKVEEKSSADPAIPVFTVHLLYHM